MPDPPLPLLKVFVRKNSRLNDTINGFLDHPADIMFRVLHYPDTNSQKENARYSDYHVKGQGIARYHLFHVVLNPVVHRYEAVPRPGRLSHT